jgi:hypothetical protein
MLREYLHEEKGHKYRNVDFLKLREEHQIRMMPPSEDKQIYDCKKAISQCSNFGELVRKIGDEGSLESDREMSIRDIYRLNSAWGKEGVIKPTSKLARLNPFEFQQLQAAMQREKYKASKLRDKYSQNHIDFKKAMVA